MYNNNLSICSHLHIQLNAIACIHRFWKAAREFQARLKYYHTDRDGRNTPSAYAPAVHKVSERLQLNKHLQRSLPPVSIFHRYCLSF